MHTQTTTNDISTTFELTLSYVVRVDYIIENNTWVRGNTRFISSVEHGISRVSAANE
jgi:hypothetical protein